VLTNVLLVVLVALAALELVRNHRAERRRIHQEQRITMTLAELKSQVEANVAAEASAVLLIKGLADKLASSANDPAAIAVLASQLKASADTLAAAVVANTPAAPAAEPPVVPEA
jgi:alkylation response protein AidB-like acyl-CoA dehydrogenase